MRQHHPRSPRRSAIRTIFIASVCLAAMAAAHLAWAMPANDDCAGATVIGALPFAASVDTSMATTGVDDQPHTCSGLALDSNTVWYEYVVPASQTLDLDTLGTSYDTVVSVYDGCGAAATELACFFDDTGEETRAPFAASVGSTIYIQISDAGVGGGLLSLGVNDDPAFKIGSLRSTQQVVGTGSPSPTGGSIGAIGQSAILSGRAAAYTGTSEGIFRRAAGGLSVIALSGMATPVGGVFRTFGPPAIQGAASIAFWASIDGVVGAREGLFSWNGVAVAPIVVEGDVAPVGGTYRGFEKFIAMSLAGDIAFTAQLSTAPENALFARIAGAVVLIAREDDPTPCGGLFRDFANNRGGLAMNALGEVVFKGSNDGNDEGVFLWQGAVVTASACEGAAAPTLGGVYRDFGEHVDINLGTDVIFMAEVDNAGFIDAIYAGPTTGVVPIAVEGDALAGTTIKGFDEDIRPSINDARQAAFYTRLAAAPFAAIAGTVGLGGAPAIVLLNGAACPFGGAIGSFGEEVDVSPSGEVVAEVGCTGGRGVIRGTAGGGFASVGNNNDLTAVGSGWLFSDGQIDGAGDLIVRSRRTSLYGSICGGGGCAPPLLMAKSPLVIPGSTGGTIEAIDRDSVNGSKEAVFTAVLSGLNRTDAILRVRPGAPITKVVESLDPLPVAVGTFGGFSSIDPFTDQVWRAAGQGRKVAFAATVNSLAYERGMFQAKGATLATLAFDGMVAPNGATLEDFSSPSISGNRVVFAAETDIGDCVYMSVKPALPLVAVACEGDLAPASIGGNIDAIRGTPTVAGKRVAFVATVVGGTESECLFSYSGTTYEPVVCTGEVLPGGGTLNGWDDGDILSQPASQGPGLAFGSENLSNLHNVLAWRKGTFYKLATDGDPVPGGGTANLVIYESRISIKGKTVLYGAGISGTVDLSGLFMARLR